MNKDWSSDLPEYAMHQALGGEGNVPMGGELSHTELPLETLEEHRRIHLWRATLSGYLRSSSLILKRNGMTAREYCGMLEIWSARNTTGPTIGELSRLLRLGHPAVVELTNRLCQKGLTVRVRSDMDRRTVNVTLTAKGRELLARLVQEHQEELNDISADLRTVLDRGRPS